MAKKYNLYQVKYNPVGVKNGKSYELKNSTITTRVYGDTEKDVYTKFKTNNVFGSERSNKDVVIKDVKKVGTYTK